jgi:hypothetical protein
MTWLHWAVGGGSVVISLGLVGYVWFVLWWRDRRCYG